METAKATEIKPETETVEIKHWSGRVLFSAAIDVSVPKWGRLKAAVELGVANGARLDGARLDGARLDRASLVDASLVGARLDGASLVGARLAGARLDGARLDGARLDGASLVGASLVGARLDYACLDGASLGGASLGGAILVGAIIGDTKVKGVVARVTRSDGYEFIAWRTEADDILITAGCQTRHGTDAYREHVRSYDRRPNGTALAAETLAILDFIDVRAKKTP